MPQWHARGWWNTLDVWLYFYVICLSFLRETAIFSLSSLLLLGSVVRNLSGLNFSTLCPSQHVHQLLGWATVVLLCFFCLLFKLCLFTHPLGELRAVQRWSVCQFIILCLLLALIKSQQFLCGTTDLKERLFVPETCYLALLKEVAISFLPGLSGLRCGDRIWRARFRSSSPVLLCYILGILRCYGNFQIFSFCKVRYLT